MVIAEVSVIPIGTKTPSVSQYVAEAVKVLAQEKGIKYQLTAMGTLVEGELDEVLGVVKKMHQRTFDGEVKRVVTSVKIDDRRDKVSTMSHKVASVMEKLG
ncbi:MAG: MTH1187 family thiamine-binding protein [Dehalococcoidia bacterium]|nr:MTH1187 family thiamine-binding protein [Dehalococcoidia bacterium]